MKRSIFLSIVTACFLVLFGFYSFSVSGTTKPVLQKGNNPIPADVLKIAEKACVNCHTAPGNKMALLHVNLSKWDKYSTETQAKKAEAMCNMVTKEKMPPKNFKKEHPEAIPTVDDVKIICNWAQSLKIPVK